MLIKDIISEVTPALNLNVAQCLDSDAFITTICGEIGGNDFSNAADCLKLVLHGQDIDPKASDERNAARFPGRDNDFFMSMPGKKISAAFHHLDNKIKDDSSNEVLGTIRALLIELVKKTGKPELIPTQSPSSPIPTSTL